MSNNNSKNKLNLEKENEYESLSTKEKDGLTNNNDLNKEPIYIMTLELEKGKPEQLKIYSDSDPVQLASYFCKEHNLDYNGLDYLKQKIQDLLNQNNINLNENKNKESKTSFNQEINNDYNNNNNLYYKGNDDKKDNYELISPKQKIKNKINSNKEYYIKNKSSSKKQGHKCKARIENNQNSDKIFNKLFKEVKYKDYKNENRYNDKLNNQIKEISNLNNSEKLYKKNNKINNYKSYKGYLNLNERNELLKLEREKELLEIKKQINKNNKFNFESKNNSLNKNNNNKKKNYFFNSNQYTKNKIKKIDNKISNILKEYEKKYSFHPSINENYKTDLTFEQRQTFYKNLYKKKKEELKNYYLNSKKDEKGNIYFKPKLISKSTNYDDNENNKNNKTNDIFNKNYYYYKKYDLDKEELYKKYYYNKNEPIIYTKKQNEKIINEKKMRAFINLFKDLDSDQDNIINGININTNKIPKNVYNIIEPLLNELKEDNQTLNKEEFILAMDKLFEDISSTDRRIILNEYSNNKNIKKNKSLYLFNSYINDSNNIYRSLTPNCYNKIRTCPSTNNNTNKLAFKHYKKIRQMFDDLCNTNDKNNDKYYDNYNYNYNNDLNIDKKEKINKKDNIGNETTNNNDKDINFAYICDCTFNNYIKKLNKFF